MRGKVGEHSYYKQTGVASGLVRSINQGMSARVKTSEEYSNVRLNNAEFGQAGRIAKVLGRFITPKYRPMILPFSQSRMCKVILEAIKRSSGSWGQRNLTPNDVSVLISALNSVSKNNPDDWGISLFNDGANIEIKFNETSYRSKLAAIGAQGVEMNCISACPWIGTYTVDDSKYADTFARANIETLTVDLVPGGESFSGTFRPQPPTGWPAFQLNFYVLIVMPFRMINGTSHILQEHCTFLAVEPPSIP